MRSAVVNEYGFALGFVIFSTLLSGVIYLLSFCLFLRFTMLKNSPPTNADLTHFWIPAVCLTFVFTLVSILFIVFDLEVTFLFPWAVSLRALDMISVLSMLAFLFILTVGFVYEWSKGALEWE